MISSPGSISSKEWGNYAKPFIQENSDHSIPRLTIDTDIIFKDVDNAEALMIISHVTDANAAIDEPITSTDYELSYIIISCQDVKYVLLTKLEESILFIIDN